MKKIFLFNGPPGCGKDTAANLVAGILGEEVYRYKMAYPLKESCHKMLGLKGTLEELEHLKEKLIDFDVDEEFIFNNSLSHKPVIVDYSETRPRLTLRQFYIYISEKCMKPLYGQDIFGKLAVEYLKNNNQDFVTISDCGFIDELAPLIKYYGESKFVLLRLSRNGTNFNNDSRTYLSMPGIETIEVENNSSIDVLCNSLQNIITKVKYD